MVTYQVMTDHIYSVELYIPHIERCFINMRYFRELCCQYDVDQSDGFMGAGLFQISPNLDESVWSGIKISVSVEQSRLCNFLYSLPSGVTVERLRSLKGVRGLWGTIVPQETPLVYGHPILVNSDDQIVQKDDLSPVEVSAIELCESFEHNLMGYTVAQSSEQIGQPWSNQVQQQELGVS
jgi:hypothetical protein